jgi:hypothetical protein
MVNSYKLVNPYIKGEFESKIKSKNSIEAAKKFYNSLSEHFNNNVPSFYFTIQKGGKGKGKFYHFVVNESRKGDEVDFSIKPYEMQNGEKAVETLVQNFESFKGRFNGGAKRRSSKRRSSKRRSSKRRSSKRSSRSSSRRNSRNEDDSDDFYRQAAKYVPVTTSPISYLYYDPIVYQVDSVFIPTFYAYLSPYVELNTRTGLTYTVPSIE